ncbi:MAG TPA: NAD(P)-dependent oxidoreductase [Steroidobacteraceae bacterium]|jgi:nucleoside-diphosphate-sugar epimerase|nr:NAD(P)-dependent oxidoreductase [Steroidobacteraceae bacterium]
MATAKRILISGAGGFIGRWSVPPLLTRGYEVHALLSDDARSRSVPAQLAAAAVHYGDLFDPTSVEKLCAAVRPTHLLHFAWIATPRLYALSAENFAWVAASLHLLRTFHQHGGTRAVLAGSCAEYDWSRVDVCREGSSALATSAAAGSTPYAICKLALQEMLASFGSHYGLSSASGRIFFPFGPYEHPERLVPSVVRKLLSDQQAPCSHGRQVRNFLHVADVGDAFAALLDSDLQGPVNIGSSERISIAALVGRIATLIGRPDLLRLGARAAGANEPAVLVPDVHRLYDEVGWRPRFTLEDGLADTIAWWQGMLTRGTAAE